MATENKGLFGGLKKLFFKEDEASTPVSNTENKSQPVPESNLIKVETNTSKPVIAVDDNLQRRAFQLIESINQPGVDFFEVWNAAIENGGVTATNVKTAFTALRFADTSLNKEKVITTGNYYCNELSKALQNDLDKKGQEIAQLKQEKESTRESLNQSIVQIEDQLKSMQAFLIQKKKELSEMDSNYDPRIKDIETKMTNGKMAITDIVNQMQQVIAIAQKEL